MLVCYLVVNVFLEGLGEGLRRGTKEGMCLVRIFRISNNRGQCVAD